MVLPLPLDLEALRKALRRLAEKTDVYVGAPLVGARSTTDDPNDESPDRRSIRLRNYDYSTPGMYFVTICTQIKEDRFGVITDDKMTLNDAGRMVKNIWRDLPERFPHIATDE